jgi:hypothetical protein
MYNCRESMREKQSGSSNVPSLSTNDPVHTFHPYVNRMIKLSIIASLFLMNITKSGAGPAAGARAVGGHAVN